MSSETPEAAGLNQAQVSHWTSYTAKRCATATLEEIHRKILWGPKGPPDDPDGYHQPRELIARRPDPRMLLEYACFHGVFTVKCHPRRLLRHSGLVTADCENLDGQGFSPEPAKNLAYEALSAAALVYTTPSGNGLRVAAAVDPAPASPSQHRQAFRQLIQQLRVTGIDQWSGNGGDLCYRCPLSFDPRALAPAPSAPPFRWNPQETMPEPDSPLTWQPAVSRRLNLQAGSPGTGTVYQITPDPAQPGKWTAQAIRPNNHHDGLTLAHSVDLDAALAACGHLARQNAPEACASPG